MKLALDYDNTFDLDPEFWHKFIDMAEMHGHEVVIVSARPLADWGYKDIAEEINGHGSRDHLIKIYLSDLTPKKAYMKWKGVHIDVWIDDSPEWIVGIV